MGKIIVNLDVEMAKKKVGLGELAERIGLTQANLSILKTGKAKAIRFTTLDMQGAWVPARRYPGVSR